MSSGRRTRRISISSLVVVIQVLGKYMTILYNIP